jgi:ABC-2 type transport system permease protein
MSLADTLPNPEVAKPASDAPVRPFYWRLRCEIWDNRSLYVAPLITGGLIVFGFIIGTSRSSGHVSGDFNLDAGGRAALSMMPYAGAALAVSATGLIVAAFYCLGALYNERRDRSVLFWKSMPVSDLTTVLAKVAIPLVVLPVIVFVITVAAQFLLMLIDTAALAGSGSPLAALWSHWPLGRMTLGLAWALIAFSLWYAPVWAWLLLVSAWARRAPFLWAVLPPLGLMLLEQVALGTHAVSRFIGGRVGGAFNNAFADAGRNQVPNPDPASFFSDPGVYIGLVIAAILIAGAVWLRRSREPT